jgi:hypothetical protein
MFQVGSTASYGLAILMITFGISYSSLSQLIQGSSSSAVLTIERMQFLNGFRIAMLALAAINACAIVPSAMRGKRQDTRGERVRELEFSE